MSVKDDGGPAFPVASERNANGDVQWGFNGMTLRDWFAGMALHGCLCNPEYTASNAQLAKDCFTVADAMLAARKEEG